MAHIDPVRGAKGRTKLSVVRPCTRPPQVLDVPQAPSRRRRPRPTPHLTADQYIRLLGFIEDEGGITTLDDVTRALSKVRSPISAIFDLCDAGILNVDWESAFDGDMRVWRVDR